ncbi:MAG: M20/M25/M40 family metallo-hydrolase [Oscillospiraceae bacterium]|nr:M20/M25/M40 family metallo-hydrolase [Oscillospiraceae bacterium]
MPFDVNPDKAIARFSELLIYETVAGNDDEFRKFKNAIKVIYPNIARVCRFEQIGDLGLMYKFEGKSSQRAIVLMAHYDVVPAVSDIRWDWHPFSGEIVTEEHGDDKSTENGEIWGRGAIDTKCTLCAVMEAVEHLIEHHDFTPDYDVYMCFGGDEETEGKSAVAIAAELEKRGVRPFLILDEGGAVVDAASIGLDGLFALVGIAEKGYMDVEFIARGTGGHTSLPVRSNPLVTIAKAVNQLENLFKPVDNKPFRIMQKALISQSKRMRLKFRIVLKSRLIRKILTSRIIKSVPEIGALTQTTGAITLISGGSAANVVPEEVRAVGNFRIISGSSVAQTLDLIKKALQGLEIEVNLLSSSEPSKISETSGEGWDMLKSAITQTWGDDCAVIPYLMFAGSDSRAYSDISNHIYRFSPMIMSKAERERIHGMNERISFNNFIKMLEFYLELLNPKPKGEK